MKKYLFGALALAGLLAIGAPTYIPGAPTFSQILGSLACTQLPALTTDVTTPAGSCVTTIANNAVTVGKMAAAGANTMLGNWTGGSANNAANSMPSCADTTGNHLNYVSGTGITCGTSTLASSQFANSLGADVLMNNTANFFDGPAVAQGSTGTWFASGTVTVLDTAGAATFICKLWDGTTVIDAAATLSTGGGSSTPISLSGLLTSPASNIKISCKDTTAITGKITFNGTATNKDSTLTVFRLN